MVTSAPCSQRSAQISWAELLEPMTTAFLPVQSPPPGCLDEWYCSPRKDSAPSNVGTLGYPETPRAKTSCSGAG